MYSTKVTDYSTPYRLHLCYIQKYIHIAYPTCNCSVSPTLHSKKPELRYFTPVEAAVGPAHFSYSLCVRTAVC